MHTQVGYPGMHIHWQIASPHSHVPGHRVPWNMQELAAHPSYSSVPLVSFTSHLTPSTTPPSHLGPCSHCRLCHLCPLHLPSHPSVHIGTPHAHTPCTIHICTPAIHTISGQWWSLVICHHHHSHPFVSRIPISCLLFVPQCCLSDGVGLVLGIIDGDIAVVVVGSSHIMGALRSRFYDLKVN